MKIILLLVILAALIGTAVIYQNQQNASLNTATKQGVKSREQLIPGLDMTAVQKLRLKDAKSEVNITIDEDRKGAKVAERGGYPASLDRISTALSDLREQKIASKLQVLKGAWAEIEVQPPGESTEGVGTQVELIGSGDKPLHTLILGKQPDTAGGQSSTQFSGGSQRMIRIPEDGDTIWVVSNTFFDLEPKPESWLDKAFIDVQKLKEVTVTAPKADEGWKVGRADENTTDFTLLDAKTGEALDSAKLPIGSLLSAPTFNDVLAKDKAGDALKDATKAKITTFDGFTYDVQVAKQSKDSSDKYYLSVTVSADIPKTRTPVKDEKEEDKKKKDEEFATTKKTKEDKLAKEQKFAGWVYEVSEYTVNNLFKKRSEIVKVVAKAEAPTPSAPAPTPVPAQPAPSAAPATPPVPATPAPTATATPPMPMPATPAPATTTTPPISVTTPPVAVPPLPKTEIKPAPSPDANPAVPEKK